MDTQAKEASNKEDFFSFDEVISESCDLVIRHPLHFQERLQT